MPREVNYTRALARGWPAIAIVFGVSIVAAYVLTKLQTPRYESSSVLVVAPAASSSEPRAVIDSIESLERRTVIATFARLASTDVLRESVTARLAIPPNRARAYRLNATVVPNTNMIRIDAEGPDASTTASFANVAALETARESQNLYRVYALRLVNRATPAPAPSHPDPKRNMVIAAIVGAALGAAAALAIDRLRTRVEDP